MDEKKVIETKLTEYENEQLKLLKSVFDMGCAFKMLALQKEANDWELKYLNEKKDFEYAQEQIGMFLMEVDFLKKELIKKESDTAKEILKWLVWNKHLFNRTHEIGFEKAKNKLFDYERRNRRTCRKIRRGFRGVVRYGN